MRKLVTGALHDLNTRCRREGDDYVRRLVTSSICAHTNLRPSDIQFTIPVYKRIWEKGKGASRVVTTRHVYLGVLGEEVHTESLSRGRRLNPVPEVLASWRLDGKNPDRLIEQHAIALTRSLVLLRGVVGGDRNFGLFHEVLREIELKGLRLDSLEEEIDELYHRSRFGS